MMLSKLSNAGASMHSRASPDWHRPQGLCRGTRHQRVHRTGAAKNGTPSIRDFIASETPVRGLNGTWQERPKDATVEAVCMPMAADQLPCPGARRIFRVDDAVLDQIVVDGGKAILCAFEPSSSPPKLLAPPRGGSYAMLAQALGVQRMSGSPGFVRMLVMDRVAVQALSGDDSSNRRALAAPLADRWAYFVRCAAVADAALDVVTLQQYGADVATALGQCRDVAADILADLRSLAHMTAQVTVGPATDLRDQLMEDEEEAQQLLEWALPPSADGADTTSTTAVRAPASSDHAEHGGNDSKQLTMEQMWRLSFAPLAATVLPEALGMSTDQLQQERLRALGAMDVGMRMEQAAQQAATMRARMAATMAVQR